ncbi:MAG TPA: nuclear transport factor 2 family protein [Kofleriaceae bacterium]|nr:nuclear transport factor 2 family protein [Kofleriaceae bacterium]
MRSWLYAVMVVGGVARATPVSDLEAQFRAAAENPYGHDMPDPRFALGNLDVRAGDDLSSAHTDLAGGDEVVDRVTIGLAGDGKSAWLAADLRYVGDCGGDGPSCGKTLATGHVGAVFERGTPWQPVVWNVSNTTTAKRQAEMIADGKQLAAIPDQIEGADAAVGVFKASIGDPKALAASVSERKDTLLYGSADGERYTGAQVKAKLAAWKLAFKVHDGIRAGLAAGGTVAWVAANLDATAAGKPGKPTPYRALFVYEHEGTRWALVQAQFSFGGW